MLKIQLDKNATGGGLSVLKLTEFEAQVANIAGMETAVHGLQGAVFGVPTIQNNNQEGEISGEPASSVETFFLDPNATPTNTSAYPQRRSVLRK